MTVREDTRRALLVAVAVAASVAVAEAPSPAVLPGPLHVEPGDVLTSLRRGARWVSWGA